ncbi:MAG: filamentous hemagglutinin N-terminal domain-containing protein, partial [Elainellaceae cyanobacterium]
MKQVSCALTLGVVASFAIAPSAMAQIVPDGTLGAEGSRLIPEQVIRGALGDRIDGGAVRGSALFHSFDQFNVNELQRVYFNNPVGIEAILSRVTGNDVSDIMGTLGVDGGADLFFLNPNGIVFGENARLDVAGSFVASTSDRFTLLDGSVFSATDPQAPPLLTVNVPVGLQPGGITEPGRGDIVSDGVLFAGQDLALNGNNLDLEGQLWAGGDLLLRAQDTLQIRDRLDAPFVAAAQGEMLVQGNQSVDIFALNHPESGLWSGGDMTLRSNSAVGGDAHYWSGGSFRIEDLDESLGGLESPNDPIIRSLGDVSFESYIGNSIHILAAGDVTALNFIQVLGAEPNPAEAIVEDLSLSNGAPFPIDGIAEPTVDIRAGVDPAVIFPETINVPDGFFNLTVLPPPVDSANIDVGTIILGTVASSELPGDFLQGRVLLTNNYRPDLNNFVPGNIQLFDTQIDLPNNEDLNGVAVRANSQFGGGAIAIDSRGDIDLRGTVRAEAIPLNLDAVIADPAAVPEYLDLGDGTFAAGGDVTLLSNGTITFEAGEPSQFTGINSVGQVGGVVSLEAGGDVLLQPFSGISSDSTNSVVPDFSTISVSSLTGSVQLNQALITAENSGSEFAGDIFLDASDRIDILNNSDVSARGVFGRVLIGSNSNPSTILLDNSRILTANNVSVVTQNFRAGDVFLQANEVVARRSQGLSTFIAADTVGSGAGGNIEIEAQQLRLLEGAEILTRTFGAGPGGDITVLPLNPQSPSSIEISGVAPFTEVEPILNADGNPVLEPDGSPALRANGGFSSGLFATTEDDATGNGGFITIGTDEARIGTLAIADGGVISARTRSVGSSQDISVSAERVVITNGGQILTASLLLGQPGAAESNVGQAGNIEVNASEFLSISGYDETYSDRFESIQDAAFEADSDSNRDAAAQRSFQLAQRTVDPVRPNSGIQASDVFGFGSAGQIAIESPTVRLSSLANIDATTRGNNDGQGVIVRSQDLRLTGGAEITSLTVAGFSSQPGLPATGRAGDIIIEPLDPDAPSSVFISGVAPSELPDGRAGGFSSGLFASTENVNLLDGTILRTTGMGGNIDVTASDLTVRNSGVIGIRSRSDGDGGNATINVDNLDLLRGGQILAASFGAGNAGDVTVNATGTINIRGVDPELGIRLLDVALILAEEIDEQNMEAGIESDPDMTTSIALENALSIVDSVSASTSVVNIDSLDDIVAPSGLQARSEVSDAADLPESALSGDIIAIANAINIANGAEINSEQQNSNSDTANQSFVGLAATSGSFNLRNARVVSTNSGTGLAGIIFVGASEDIRITQQGEILSEGNLGSILLGETLLPDLDSLVPNQVQIRGASQVRTDNENAEFTGGLFSDEQEAGQILIRASDRVTVRGEGTRVSSDTFNQADAGLIDFQSSSRIVVTDQAQISSSTFFQGDAGDVFLTALDSVQVDNGATIFTTVEADARGDSGSISIDSRMFSVTDSAQLQTQVNSGGVGNAGDILIDVTESVELDNEAALFSSIGPDAAGNGGTIFVGDIDNSNDDRFIIRPTATFSATDGSQLITSTGGRRGTLAGEVFTAGDVFIVADDVSFNGVSDNGLPSAVFSGVDVGGRGRGGSVLVIGGVTIEDSGITALRPSSRLDVSDGAVITVSSFGTEDIGGESNQEQ